jgi:general secretion pathway protein F
MTAFRYKAANADGRLIEGTIEAADRDSAARALLAQGSTPITIDTERKAAKISVGTYKASGKQRASGPAIDYFTLELATLLKAGLPLGQALDTVADTTDDPALSQRVDAINQAVRGGQSLSQALQAAGPEFDPFYCNMVRAGESGGALAVALERLAEFRQHRRETSQAIVSALIYPTILLGLALVAVAVLLAFVVPQFTQMFADVGRELPLLTRIVAGTGNLVANWWWLMLAVIGAIGYALYRDWQAPAGRARWDAGLLRLWIVGSMLRKLETGRFARTLGTLLENGVSLVSALDISREIISNTQLAAAVEQATRRVREGSSLSAALSESSEFPPLTLKLIDVGEHSGQLNTMLQQIAEIYERDVQTAMKRLFTLAEPVIIITIALVITVIILSVVLVIIESNNLVF